MDYAETLAGHFETLGFPPAARVWLLDVWRLLQVIDDAADGDAVTLADAEAAAVAAFVRMPINPFFVAHAGALSAVLALQVAKWRAANAAEREGQADERSYMWRAGYYDLIAAAALLCGLDDEAQIALSLYGETFVDYRGEFPCQPPQ